MDEFKVPIYLMTGFLESGKTSFLNFTLAQEYFQIDEPTLLILCEEGEEEYDKKVLKKSRTSVEVIDSIEELTTERLVAYDAFYNPGRVIIEYNGMWKLEDLLQLKYPRKWQIQGIYSTVNGTTLDMYLKNMRNMLMEQLTESELIIINRCPEGVDRSGFRRALKVQNPMAQLIFEGMDGKIIQPTAEDLPFDIKENPIKIEDEDFGIWYVDAYDHPDQYMDKEIEFVAQAFRPKGMKNDMFVPVRKIMTCCADDVRLYGYPCKIPKVTNIQMQKWYRVRVRYSFEPTEPFAPEQPVLYLMHIEPAEAPEQDYVYLG